MALHQHDQHDQHDRRSPRFLVRAVALLALSGSIGVFSGILHAETPAKPAVNPVEVDYQNSVQPIFSRYCTGCHNAREPEGELSLESYADIQKGGAEGPILASTAEKSRLLGVLNGTVEPAMPPEGEPRPTTEEIGVLSRWINSGSKAQSRDEKRVVTTPRLTPAEGKKPITAIAVSPNGNLLAIARYDTVELFKHIPGEDPTANKPIHRLEGHSGKINDLRFTPSSEKLLVAGGIAGRNGEIILWDVENGKKLKTFSGHQDTVYVAIVSDDEKTLASGSYDQKILIWDFQSGEILHTLSGHNGPVFDLAFSPDANNLVSASGDTTVKVWHVPSGRRVDTRSEPLKEQYSVAFSPDGSQFVAGGADNRIRVWKLVSRDQLKINPMLHARFGHEGAITRLRYSADGKSLVSAALDNSLKVWNMPQLSQRVVYEDQPDSIEALAIDSVGNQLVAGRMDGSLGFYPLAENLWKQENLVAHTEQDSGKSLAKGVSTKATILNRDGESKQIQEVVEQEPNNSTSDANRLHPPSVAQGTIETTTTGENSDSDLFRFFSRQGESWILEIDAARNDSPLDSKIEVLDAEGKPVTRVFLQAVRDSYFTFRGKNSNQIDDFRLHNWREMQLNQYLYANGEVVRLYHYPRGPDSGFKVYPNFGLRQCYYDTTPLSHALGEVCYIVEAHQSEKSIIPNGLPVFPINYENDDDSRRLFGSDSRLTFKAPKTGEYLVRVRDVRNFSGSEYTYKLRIRPKNPGFHLRFDRNLMVPPGGGRRVNMKLKRTDGFEGPVQIEVANLPEGFTITAPLSIEAGQHRATALVQASSDAAPPSDEAAKKVKVVARGMVNGTEVVEELGDLGTIKLDRQSKLNISVILDNEALESDGLPVLLVPAGKTIKCRLEVHRKNHEGLIGFGREEAAWNMPHGLYVDNIGLNGVLMPANENQREVFITCESWVEAQERPIFFEATIDGRPTSKPMMLRVIPMKTTPLVLNNPQ